MPSDPDDSADVTPVDEVNGTVLSPDELDFSGDQHVVELDDGRYLISPNEPPSAADEPSISPVDLPEPEPGRPSTPSEPAPTLDAEAVHAWLASRLERADSRYGFDITAVFEGDVVRQELFSNDVITTFENLLVWYAQHVGGDTPVEDVLGILLAQSTAPIRLPPHAFDAIIRASGVGPADSVADLVEVVHREGGLRFPSTGTDD